MEDGEGQEADEEELIDEQENRKGGSLKRKIININP